MGPAIPRDHPGLAERLGARHAVPDVWPRGAPRDLYHERDRGAQPPAAQSDQNERPLPQRGRREKADLPSREQRRAGLDHNQELDSSAARLQNPIRRPTTRLTPPTQKTGHPPILPLLRTSFDEFERSAMQHRDELGALALGEVAGRLAGRGAAVRED